MPEIRPAEIEALLERMLSTAQSAAEQPTAPPRVVSEITEVLHQLHEHRMFWIDRIAAVQAIVIPHDDDHSFRALLAELEEPGLDDPTAAVRIADRVIDLSRTFIAALPGGPTVGPPSPRPRPR
jgi:hypothetical protein